MRYLNIFEDYIPLTSQSDFDEISQKEFVDILLGVDRNFFDADSVELMKKHVEDRWDPFTKKEVNTLRNMFAPKRQSKGYVDSIGDSNVKPGCCMTYSNLTQTLTITKLRDYWFALRFSGGLKGESVQLSFKCDHWNGLMKCLKHLRKMGIKLFQTVYSKQFESVDYSQYFEEVSVGEYYSLFSGSTNNAEDQQTHMETKWAEFTDKELKSIKSFFKPNKHPSDRNSKFYNCRIRFYKPGGGNINITKLSNDSYLVYLMGKMEDSGRGPRRDENLHFFKCDSWNGFIMCLKYLRKNMSRDVAYHRRLFK